MQRIAIIQQIVPKYRISFFNKLQANINFELYASKEGLEKSIFTVHEGTDFKIDIINKINFFNFAIFQFIPFKKLFLKEIVIFEFNIRIISNILLLLIRIVAKKRNILWTHGITKNMSFFSKLIRVFLMKKSSSIIVYEYSGKKNLIKLGIPKKKIFIAKNSIDIKHIYPYVNLKEKKNRITFIGRVIKEKNVPLLCRAFVNIIHKIDKSIILTIIGDGEELESIKTKFKNDRIEFTGQIYIEKKISKYLNQSIITVSPDYLGLAIIHSFCYSVPIVVNKFPNINHSPEIELFQDNVNGYYFSGSQLSLENQIIKCINNPKKLLEFGKNGSDLIKKNYGVEIMVSNFLKALNT